MHKTNADAQTHMHKQCRIDTHKASGLFTSRLIKTIYALHFYDQYFKYSISTVLKYKSIARTDSKLQLIQ